MLTYDLSRRDHRPLYEELYQRIRDDIQTGRLAFGERLPSKRSLASHLGVSVTTVEHAYQQLESEGFVEARRSSGFYVRDLPSPTLWPASADASAGVASTASVAPAPVSAPAPEYSIDFKANHCSLSLFPATTWAKLLRQVLSGSDTTMLEALPWNGLLSLRCAIADYLRRFRGIEASPDQIVIGAGTEYLYGKLLQLLGPCAVLAFEDPGYKKLAHISAKSGIFAQYIPIDEQGLIVSRLRETATTAVHVSPANHFPTGTIMSTERRAELLAWANDQPYRYIIEDDYDCEFSYAGTQPTPLYALCDTGRVIYLNTFSKSLVPSLRIGYMVLPPSIMELYRQTLSFYSCTVSSFEQQTLALFISKGHFERHLNHLRTYYEKKRRRLVEVFEASRLVSIASLHDGGAGTHVMLRVDTDMTDEDIRRRARDMRISLSLLSDYSQFPSLQGTSTIVLNFAGMEDDDLERAIALLEQLFDLG